MKANDKTINKYLDEIEQTITELQEEMTRCISIERKTEERKQKIFIQLTEKQGERRALKKVLHGEENSDNDDLPTNQ
jgi:hypothetical protein